MIIFKSHRPDMLSDACCRCWVSRKALKLRPDLLCSVPDDSLHLGEGPNDGPEWHGLPGYFYFCVTCGLTKQLGEDNTGGDLLVHECLHGNRGLAPLLEPLDVIQDALRALHFRPRDPYAEHRESLRGIEAVDLKPADELGDAWASATWEEL